MPVGIDCQQDKATGHRTPDQTQDRPGLGQTPRLSTQSDQVQNQGQGTEEAGSQKGKQGQTESKEPPKVPTAAGNRRDIKSDVDRLSAMSMLKGNVKGHLRFSECPAAEFIPAGDLPPPRGPASHVIGALFAPCREFLENFYFVLEKPLSFRSNSLKQTGRGSVHFP
jgi:hypothetical protein